MNEIDYSSIDPGDHIAVKFEDDGEGEFTISGSVNYGPDGESLTVGGWTVLDGNRRVAREVVEVTEHRAKEPAVGYFGVSDDGTLWARSKNHGWLLINTYEGIVGKGYSWEQVVDILDGAGLMPVTA